MIAFLLITLLLSSISLADAYFYLPNSMLNLPFQGGMATAQRNNTLIMFGGENATDRFTNNLYQLSQLSDTFQWQAIEQKDPPPGTLYGQAVVTNNNFMYLFGGMTNDTKEKILPLQYYRFSFDTNTWTAAPTNTENMPSNATFPVNRMLFSATYDGQNKIYIYGGSINSSLPLPDFHVFDITTHQFTRLPDPNFFRYGHTASYLR
jgi:N-acetylneuraminic acid mutarotase